MNVKRRPSRAFFFPLFILIVFALLIAVGLVVQYSDPHMCGNGPIYSWSLKPTAEQATYVVLTNENTKGALPGNVVRSSFMTRLGVFVGFGKKDDQPVLTDGLAFVTPKTIEVCQSSGVHVTGLINKVLYGTASGEIWAVSDGNGVYHFQDGAWKNLTVENSGLADNRAYDVFRNSNGEIFVATWNGISKYEPSIKRFSNFGDPSLNGFSNHIHAILVTDSIWMGSIHDGVEFLHDNGWQNFRATGTGGLPGQEVVPQLESNEIRVIAQSADGKIWVGSDPGLAVFDPATNAWSDESPGMKFGECSVLDVAFKYVGTSATNYSAWMTGNCGTYIHDGNSRDAFWSDGLTIQLGVYKGQFDESTVIIGSNTGLYIGKQ